MTMLRRRTSKGVPTCFCTPSWALGRQGLVGKSCCPRVCLGSRNSVVQCPTLLNRFPRSKHMATKRFYCRGSAHVVAVLAGLLMMACEARCRPGTVLKNKVCVTAQDGAASVDPSSAGEGTREAPGLPTVPDADPAGTDVLPVGEERTEASGPFGTAGHSGRGSDAGRSGGNSAAASMFEACTDPGALRCSKSGAGAQELCGDDGVWTASAGCSAGQTCVSGRDGKPTCVEVAELCRARGGEVVCDDQGALAVCDLNESIVKQMECNSKRHCEAGTAMQSCALCLPNEEFRCAGSTLERCAADGLSFVAHEHCETEALCNAMLGACTDAVCNPDQFSCDGNSLLKCNADGTSILTTEACGTRTCDAQGGDCNLCDPGDVTCDGDSVATCDSTGQQYMTAPCPNAFTCIGLGQCVECDEASRCTGLSAECKVGSCVNYRCTQQNAPNGTACNASGRAGTCSNGTCRCTPQCAGKQCGPDGCGGECGRCDQVCSDAGRCVECETAGDCPSTFACTRNQCACSLGSTLCQSECISSTACCTNSDCQGANTTCNARHQCVCESSEFRLCSTGGCVVRTGCCRGEAGRACTASGGGEGQCDSGGNCVKLACDSVCANKLYRPCSQCTAPTFCSIYSVCTINCSSPADCPGGSCESGQCRRPCTSDNSCLPGTVCDGRFCAWNGNG